MRDWHLQLVMNTAEVYQKLIALGETGMTPPGFADELRAARTLNYIANDILLRKVLDVTIN